MSMGMPCLSGKIRLLGHEFSNHIIELGMLKKDRTVKEIIKNYHPSDTVKVAGLKQKHDSDIEKVYYFEELGNIIAIEKDSPKVAIILNNSFKFILHIIRN